MIPEPFTLDRQSVDWTRHGKTKAPKILPPPGEVWRTPGGRKQAGRYYTRTTTLVKALEEAHALYGWKVRRALVGIGQRPDYAAMAAALTIEDHDRDALEELAELCIEASGPSKALIGTMLHAFTERVDRGEPLGFVPEAYRELVEAWQRITAPLRLEYREVRTVHDELGAAGTPDAFGFCELPDPDGVVDDRRVIDLKSGSIKYPASMSGQLYVYAASDLYDPETGERRPLEVNCRWGLIVHLLSDGSEPPGLYWLNLEHGRQCVELAIPVRAWRAVKPDAILRPALVEERVPATPAPGDELVDITEALRVPSERVVEPPPELEAVGPHRFAVGETVHGVPLCATCGLVREDERAGHIVGAIGSALIEAPEVLELDDRLAERRHALEQCAEGVHCATADEVCAIDSGRDDHATTCCTCHAMLVEPEPEPVELDPIAVGIARAVAPRELVLLWQQHREAWTPEHDELAAARRAALDEQRRLERPHAALAAAITTAATPADMLELWRQYREVWTDEHDELATRRARELTEGAA